jgi:hypothetical protein
LKYILTTNFLEKYGKGMRERGIGMGKVIGQDGREEKLLGEM